MNPLSEIAHTEFVAFDLETTGLHPVAAQIVEIGAVRFRGDGEVLGQFEQLIDPQCDISAEVSEIHGITNQMVAGQPAIRTILPLFIEFLGDAPAVLLAHNAPFDVGFLSVALSRLRQPSPTHPVIDTCTLARRRVSLANYKLETLGREFRLTEDVRHRALQDALLLKDVFTTLIRKRPVLRQVQELYNLATPSSLGLSAGLVDAPPPGYEELWQAVAEQQPVEMEYQGGHTPGATRVVTPLGMMQVRQQIYLNAFCHQSGGERTFRLDRIVSCRRIGR